MLKDQLFKRGGSQFDKLAFRAKIFSELARNRPLDLGVQIPEGYMSKSAVTPEQNN